MIKDDIFVSTLTYNPDKDYNEVTVSKIYVYKLQDGSRRTKTFNIVVRSKDHSISKDDMIEKGVDMLQTQYRDFIRDKHIVINV